MNMQATLAGRQIGQATGVVMLSAHGKQVLLQGCGGTVQPKKAVKIGINGIKRALESWEPAEHAGESR